MLSQGVLPGVQDFGTAFERLKFKLDQRVFFGVWLRIFCQRVCLAIRLNLVDICWPLCHTEEESALHLFSDCFVVRYVAFATKWSMRLEGLVVNSAVELVDMCLNPPASLLSSGLHKNFFATFF